MAEFDSLNRNQRRAIPVLLQSRTIAEAAGKLHLSERTLYRYLEDTTFRAALGQAESAAIHNAARRLIRGSGGALDVLQELMLTAESESVRRLAASDWISNTLRWAELATVAARVQEMEDIVNGRIE
jgi:hypothetical protein